MAYAVLYDRLLSLFNFSVSLGITAAALSLPTLLFSPFISFPSTLRTNYSASTTSSPQPATSSICSLFQSPSFWLYVLSTFGAQVGFAFIPFFPKLSSGFHVPSSTVTAAFDLVFFLTSLLRPVAGALMDFLGIGDGAFSMGSKNLMCLLLGAQMGLFGILPGVVEKGDYFSFVGVVGGILGVFACAACVAAVLARDLFGEENGVAAFGVGGAVAMGLGEFSSTQMISMFARGSLVDGPRGFELFYWISALWSGISLVAAVRMQKCTKRRSAVGRDIERGESAVFCNQCDYETF